MINVTAAILEQNGNILIAQRPADKSCALLWEFPGGKQEKDESLAECLKRECREELNIEIEEPVFFFDVLLPEKNLHLHFFKTAVRSGTLTKKEHNSLQWISKAQLGDFAFCPSDAAMLEKADLHALFAPYASFPGESDPDTAV